MLLTGGQAWIESLLRNSEFNVNFSTFVCQKYRKGDAMRE